MRPGEISDEQVKCLVCGRVFRALNSHLRTHGLTKHTYLERFPGAVIISVKTNEKRGGSVSKGLQEFLETPEGEQWRREQSIKSTKFAAENPRVYAKSPEHAKKIGEGVHRFHLEHPTAASEKMTPEVRAKISETVTELSSDPEYKKKQSEEAKEYCRTHPDFRKKTPEQIENHRESLEQYFETPEGVAQRQRQSEMMKVLGKQRYQEDPESFQSFIEAGQSCVIYKDTKPERAMAVILTSLSLKSEPQGRIGELNKSYRYHKWDFILREAKVAIEVDGCYWHGCPEHFLERRMEEEVQYQIALEDQRDLEADLSGWQVLRFWEHEVMERPDEVAQVILKAVKRTVRMAG